MLRFRLYPTGTLLFSGISELIDRALLVSTNLAHALRSHTRVRKVARWSGVPITPTRSPALNRSSGPGFAITCPSRTIATIDAPVLVVTSGRALVGSEALEETPAVFLRVLVDPHHEGALSPLLAQVPDGSDVEHIGAGVAAHGLQPLQHFFGDPHGLFLVHRQHILRQKPWASLAVPPLVETHPTLLLLDSCPSPPALGGGP